MADDIDKMTISSDESRIIAIRGIYDVAIFDISTIKMLSLCKGKFYYMYQYVLSA